MREKMRGFDGTQVVETESFVFFWRPPAVFCQWTPSKFVVDGVWYSCAEQYMMAEKARLFEDEDVRVQILATDSPRAHKKLGRKVKGFVGEVWEAQRSEIVYRGSLAKFGQNPHILAQLLATGEKTLVEASPLDTIWGIGLDAVDEAAQDPSRWKGLNLLGEALMRVRAELR